MNKKDLIRTISQELDPPVSQDKIALILDKAVEVAKPVTLSVLGLLTPITGALVHNAGSVLVVLNAALLYGRKL